MTYQEILQCNELLTLYTQIDVLTKDNSVLYKQIEEYKEAKFASIDKKEQLTLNNNLLNALNYQLELVKNDNQRLNHNFRMLAKKMLTKETYGKINELSFNRLNESKELIKNQTKLEL